MEAVCTKSFPPFLDYKTEKYVLTKNRKIGVFHRLLQLGVLIYVIGWVFIVKKGYQESDKDPHISVITKMKGASITKNFKDLQERLWDVADFVKPAQGENVLFLVTNFISTPGQILGLCPESPTILDGRCTEDLNCTEGEPVISGNGIKTGKCNTTQFTCEIYGWCPVENPGLIPSNTNKTLEQTYLRSCTYDPVTSPYCPVFKVSEMMKQAGHTFTELSFLGGVVGIDIMWNCDLDQSDSTCKPQYLFRLQDRKNNFRTATYYWDRENREYRDLLKLYGIRLEISVTGEARKFALIPTFINLGIGCAFLGAITLLCDLILLYLNSRADFYWDCKYEEAKPPKKPEATDPTTTNMD
ncbi:P2X purinoceptor 6 isoform X2 [Engystomops pustulosus]|uniref:P2X purinoceptor 6 isoform X2 n=1 Tax=Engystomops pustulosus TaxID=76066 RepID=UPI003AFA5054